jgi:hypothetical protein
MRLTRVRFTLGLMMIVVAVVAGLLGAVETKRRRDRFLRLAEFHEASITIRIECGRTSHRMTNALGEDVRTWSPEKIEWHRLLAETYRSKAERLYPPVIPDPSPPAE